MGDLMDLMDLIDALDGGGGRSSGGGGLAGSLVNGILPGASGFNAAVWTIFVIALIGVAYTFASLTRRNIGRKAGLVKDWMVFVPFARTTYLLQIVGEPWWKLFFLEGIWFYPPMIIWFFGLFNNYTMSTFGSILATLYFIGMFCYKIYFRVKFNKMWGIKQEFALGMCGTIWGFFFLRRMVECLIAYTDLFQYGITPSPRRVGDVVTESAMPRQSGGMSASRTPAYSGGCSLSGMSGMYAGQEIPMAANDDLIIGRDASLANIVISQNSDKVSRKHCIIRYDSARSSYSVTDCSSNGTFLDNGTRLAANIPTPVGRGSVIYLGNRENRFKLN